MVFFATSHGNNACDVIGGTIKRLAANANLKRHINQLEPGIAYLYPLKISENL